MLVLGHHAPETVCRLDRLSELAAGPLCRRKIGEKDGARWEKREMGWLGEKGQQKRSSS